MISLTHFWPRPAVSLVFAFFVSLNLGLGLKAQTFWTGPDFTFTQSDSNSVDVLVPGAVSLTRGYSQWLYNPAAGDLGPGPGTPTDTEWAFGTLDNYGAYQYLPFASYRNGDFENVLVGNPMVVHLINENIYLSLTFSAWPQHGGEIAYTRSTPIITAPVVTITNPVSGAAYAAPASVNVAATATTTSGFVPTVSFYANGALIGSSQTRPFQLTDTGLAAGSYAFTAVASSSGLSTTSAVVNVVVVTPIVLSSARSSGTQFSFAYSASPGHGYVIQTSTNLVDWVSLATNTATGTSATFTNTISSTGSLLFRVVLAP